LSFYSSRKICPATNCEANIKTILL